MCLIYLYYKSILPINYIIEVYVSSKWVTDRLAGKQFSLRLQVDYERIAVITLISL